MFGGQRNAIVVMRVRTSGTNDHGGSGWAVVVVMINLFFAVPEAMPAGCSLFGASKATNSRELGKFTQLGFRVAARLQRCPLEGFDYVGLDELKDVKMFFNADLHMSSFFHVFHSGFNGRG